MQFKKLAAIAGSALMTGLALAGPALATQVSQLGKISNMVSVSGSTVSFPMFVIGANAATADVAGAVDMAVNMASNAVVTSSVTGTGAGETVTGGAKIATSGIFMTPYLNPQSVKGVLTASDIPSLLNQGTYSASTGGTYNYKQYLYILGDSINTVPAEIKFDRPSTENTPRISFKAPGSSKLYTYKLTFSTPVSLASATSTPNLQALIQGTTLNFLGKDFVISDAAWASTTDTITSLTLLGGKNVVSVQTGTPQTVTIDSKDYTVTLSGVAVQSIGGTTYYSAIGDINGEQFTMKAGETHTLSDGTTLIAAIKVLQGKTGAPDFATIAIGADKITLTSTGTVTKGSGTVVTELTSSIVATEAGGWSSLKIDYAPSSDNELAVGGQITDPFASTFNIKFNSITPDFSDTVNRQNIVLSPSAYNIMLKYTNAGDTSTNMYSLYTAAGTTWLWAQAAVTVTNGDNGYRDVVFDEGQNISSPEQDYFVIQKGGFSHTMQFTSFTPATSTMTFTDEVGNSITATNTTATAADLIVDGNTYKVKIIDATKKLLNIDLNGDGNIAGTAAASYVGVGNETGKEYSFLVPKLITTGQGGLYFYSGNKTAITPTTAGTYVKGGLFGFDLTNSTPLTAATITGNLRVGSTSIGAIANGTINNVTGTADDGYIDMVVDCTLAMACNVGLGNSATGLLTDPGYVLVEEAQQGGTTHDWVFLPAKWDATYKTYIGTPVSDDTNFADTSILGTATEYKGMTTYGTLIDHLGVTLGGSATISYPDVFTFGNIYVLTPTGTISSGSVGGTTTTQKILPIVSDVVKIDTDSDIQSALQNYDSIIVGGPCVNRIAAQILGKTYPACGAASGIAENSALVQLFADKFATGKTALLVAGWEAAQTDLASRIIQTETNGLFSGATASQMAGSSITITGTVAVPSYSP